MREEVSPPGAVCVFSWPILADSQAGAVHLHLLFSGSCKEAFVITGSLAASRTPRIEYKELDFNAR
jgi:hypothetical protein